MIVCTASHTIVAADIDAGSVFNQACVDSDETSTEVCDDETVELSELEIVKEADVDFYAEVGDVINYTITATNTGESVLSSVDISDNLMDDLDDWTCDPTLVVDQLQPGEEIVCTASYTIVAADIEAGSVFNQACTDSDETLEVCDDVDTPLAQLEIVKEADVETYTEVGEVIDYTITATNTGQATLRDVDISDNLMADLDGWTCSLGDTAVGMPVDELLSGQSIVCTASYTIVAADIEAGSVFNQACADSDETLEVCDDVDTPLAQLEIVKEADVETYTEVGEVIDYTITATNTGQASLMNVDISDNLFDVLDGWTCDPTIPVGELTAGQSIVCTASYTIVAADIEAGSVFNQACTDSDETLEVCDDVDTPLAQLEIVKEADSLTYGAVGDEIAYTITATNTGEVELTNVDISDALIDGLASWSCDPGNPVDTLAVGDSIVCTATYVIAQQDIDRGEVFNQACVDSDETNQICDDVVVYPIEVVIIKTPSVAVADSGDEVTFSLDFSHSVPISVYTYSLLDDVYGDLFDADNPNGDISSNDCIDYKGVELLPNTWYECTFVARVYGTTEDPHENTATITVTDIGPNDEVGGVQRFASWSDSALVEFKPGVTNEPVTPKPTSPPTDMLLVTDTFGTGDAGGTGTNMLGWTIWVLLSSLLIVGSGWIIRRERPVEVRR